MNDTTTKLIAALLIGGLTGAAATSIDSTANAQQGPSNQGGDALWHLPKLAEQGWFLHAHNGRVRACNVNRASVSGEKPGPRCTSWE